MSPERPTASATVMQLVEDQLTEERSTKTSLEGRAISVITSSGALATLLFALAALVTDAETFVLPGLPRWLLVAALLAFLAAAMFALRTARPDAYQEVTVDSLRDAIAPAAMSAPVDAGEASVAAVLVDIIEAARKRNGEKARYLRNAVWCQAAGAVILAIAVVIVLATA